MKQPIFYTAGQTAALRYAGNRLQQWGHDVSPVPTEYVTHLLLPVPSFESPGMLKGSVTLSGILKNLPENITILGGNLPELPYRRVDFLADEYYLTENAAITAHCAVKLVQRQYPDIIRDVPVLIIGWGRIGKQLVPLLKAMGAIVTVAVRKECDIAALQAIHCNAVLLSRLAPQQYRILINTAPAPVLDEKDCLPDGLLLDLASFRGIAGSRVLWARGLPNQDAPAASGNLIAKTALRYALGKE